MKENRVPKSQPLLNLQSTNPNRRTYLEMMGGFDRNKGLTNEELPHGVKTGFEQGWDKIKLYFTIGLPGETDVDVFTCVV
jgi:hypothetical protein